MLDAAIQARDETAKQVAQIKAEQEQAEMCIRDRANALAAIPQVDASGNMTLAGGLTAAGAINANGGINICLLSTSRCV